jgi:uncharacterized cupin superfamily protein
VLSDWTIALAATRLALMSKFEAPVALEAAAVPTRARLSNYPEPFATRMTGRQKRVLGDLFGLKNFGVNLTRLAPGAQSALRHRHSLQDEFIYIVDGEPTLVTDLGETALRTGMCAGFAAGGTSHHLVNRTDRDVVFIEVGDRTAGDRPFYPDDDIQAVLGDDGKWRFAHKNGTPY